MIIINNQIYYDMIYFLESINKCDEAWTNSVGGGQYRLSETTLMVTSPLVPASESPTQSVNDLPDFNIATTSNHSDDIYKRLEEVSK